jgi:hypothetical protein
MSVWNYRVLDVGDEGEPRLTIAEVYYDDDGRPVSWAGGLNEGADVVGVNIEELRGELGRMQAALEKPVLRVVDGKLEES